MIALSKNVFLIHGAQNNINFSIHNYLLIENKKTVKKKQKFKNSIEKHVQKKPYVT